MAAGPGRYDDIVTLVRDATNAQTVIVIILDGNRGSGFGCQSETDPTTFLPELLRDVANEIEKEEKGVIQ